MRKPITAAVFGCILVLQACGPAATPQQQQQRQHDIACVTGTLAGALIGGTIGSEFGGGRGQDILTAGGAASGALAGQSFAC